MKQQPFVTQLSTLPSTTMVQRCDVCRDVYLVDNIFYTAFDRDRPVECRHE